MERRPALYPSLERDLSAWCDVWLRDISFNSSRINQRNLLNASLEPCTTGSWRLVGGVRDVERRPTLRATARESAGVGKE